MAIWALFDQEMDEASFKNNFRIEIEKKAGLPYDDVTADFSLRFEKVENKTKVYFVPKNILEAKKKYIVTILD